MDSDQIFELYCDQSGTMSLQQFLSCVDAQGYTVNQQFIEQMYQFPLNKNTFSNIMLNVKAKCDRTQFIDGIKFVFNQLKKNDQINSEDVQKIFGLKLLRKEYIYNELIDELLDEM
ncbi:EF-hand_domain pair [Hexamita inflata]|uniref:EF-hand domain pair n=1 Tax=Hexamita inflata TaxID=28002 RepID=A0AA86NNN6_9EUKA|nr:EF-hand domain pair [Hexamita inflata]